MNDDVLTISRDELRDKLTRNDDFKLVMSLSEWDFQRKHIRGSIHFDTPEEMLRGLRKDEEIVVYCSNPASKGSVAAYHLLVDNVYSRVRRYADGLSDWEAAGLPLEGKWINGDATEEP